VTTWVLLLAAIVLEVTGTLSLRASNGFAKWVWRFPS
jgi:small multidrug resistance pump